MGIGWSVCVRTSLGTMLSLMLLLLGVLVAPTLSQPDPCDPVNYNELNEPHRSTGYKHGFPEKPLCDIHLAEGWYRFTSGAGGRMPESCPDRLSCGTVVPIWMNGKHPTVDEGTVIRKACGNFANEEAGQADPCCEHSVNIAVKNCGSYFVYYLTPTPSCPVAYCAGDIPPCPLGKWSPSGFEPGCKDECPLMKDPPVLSDPIIAADNKSFHFDCTLDYTPRDPDQRFEVIWTFDGQEDPNLPPEILSDPQRVARLEGWHLKGHVNTNVGCQIRPFYQGNHQHKCPELISNTYYAGIQVSPGVSVSESRDPNKVTQVEVTSTIPVLCDHDSECCLVLKLDVDHTRELSVETMCDYRLCKDDWNPATHTATTKVPVVARKDMVTDGDKTVLMTFEKLLPAGGGEYMNVFEGHTPEQVPIKVEDELTSTCNLWGDPHIRGFDYQSYHLFKTGDFTIYDIPVQDVQVQVRTWACGRVACICGVTVRENNDVIRVSQCDQQYKGRHTSPIVDIVNDLREGTIVQRSENGRNIGIYLPSGMEVKIDAHTGHLDVTLTSPSSHHEQSRGLCGTNDGHKTNEFTHPDGKVDQVCRDGERRCIPVDFLESWRAPSRTSMFENVPTAVPDEPLVRYCACDDPTKTINCTVRGDIEERDTACHGCPDVTRSLKPLALLGGGWTKRDVSFVDVDVEDTPYVHKDLPDIDPAMPWPSDNGMTEAQAKDACEKAVQKAQLYSVCQGRGNLLEMSVIDCMADILFSGTLDFLDSVTSQFTSECMTSLASDPNSFISSVGGRSIMKPQYAVCHDGCMEHGKCVSGQCVCEAGWSGKQCHIKAGQGVSVDSVRGGPLCDLQTRPCEKVFLDVANLDLTQDLTCRVQLVEANGTPVGRPVTTEGTALSAHRIACDVPKTVFSSQKYAISASNDGRLYGNSLTLEVYDSSCLECSATGCTQKPKVCHIDSHCYLPAQHNPADSLQICDVTQSTTSWTDVTTTRPLTFLPTLTGPDTDFLMTCKFLPPDDVTGDFLVTWEVDSHVIADVILREGVTEATLQTSQLPATGMLTCQVELNGAKSTSSPVDLSAIKH